MNFFKIIESLENKHDSVNIFCNKIFKKKIILKFILFNVLINLIGTVIACILFVFFKKINYASYILGTPIISYNLSTIVMSGYIVYRNSFCRWSKLAHQGMMLYWITFMIDKFIFKLHYVFHISITITLTIILLYTLLYINKKHKFK